MSGEPRTVTFRIPKTGLVSKREVTIETSNYVGVACEVKTKQMLKNLTNGPSKTEYKDEYYQEKDGTNVLINED